MVQGYITTANGMIEVLEHEDRRKFAQIPKGHAETLEKADYKLISWGDEAVRFEPSDDRLGVSIVRDKDGYRIRLTEIRPKCENLDTFYNGMKRQGGVAFTSRDGNNAYTAPMFLETALATVEHHILDNLEKRRVPEYIFRGNSSGNAQ